MSSPAEATFNDTDNSLKLEALKQELKREHVVTHFKNPDHLATHVAIDLHNLIKENRLPTPDQPLTPAALRLMLSLHFDLEELRTLCFDLGVDFDDLRGEGKAAKTRELVAYMQRRGQVEKLTHEISKHRPEIKWS